MKAKVKANGVLVRQSNTNMSPVIGSVAPGTILDIEAEYGEWVKLADGGWVKACYTEATDLSGAGTSWNDLTDKPFYTVFETSKEQAAVLDLSGIELKEEVSATEESTFDAPDGVSENSYVVLTYESASTIKGFTLERVGENTYRDEENDVEVQWGFAGFSDYLEIHGLYEHIGKKEDHSLRAVVYNIVEIATAFPLDEKYLPKAEAVADATDAPTAEDFNALLASLRAAGYLAE